jgi:cytochrome c-type biogenesis protein CcmE
MERRVRILVVLGMIAVLAALMSVGSEPEVDLSVDELMDSPKSHEGESFRLHGAIRADSIDSANRTLVLEGETGHILIDYGAVPLPTGATDGKTISIRGEFDMSQGQWTMHADEIKTGCPSKYEPEAIS